MKNVTKPMQALPLAAALLLAGTGASAQDTLHLNANWESADGAWRARLFAKNATDEEYLNNIFAANVGGGRFGTWAMPRQIGFEVTREFGG